MKTTDPIIVTYDSVHDKILEREIAYYGWENNIPFMPFFHYASSYRFAADTLFEKFKDTNTLMSDLDRLGFSICFLYRHSIELSLKFIYMTCRQNENDNKKYLQIGHHLLSLWENLYPLIATSIHDEKEIRHYIAEFDKFDPESMMMRYPVKKDNTPNKMDTKLNILIFAEAAQKLQSRLFSIGEAMSNQSKG